MSRAPNGLSKYDVIVVGGGPAGCAAAFDLAAAGIDVLIVDRADFPRAKPCAGGLAVKTLKRLRFAVDPVIEYRARAIEFGFGWDRTVRVGGDDPIVAMTVRRDLDAFVLERTLERGARFERIGTLSVRPEKS